MISSAEDMSSWLIAQNHGGRGPNGNQILAPETTALMHTPSPNSGNYALGWSVGETPSGAPIIDHGGDLMTSTAYQAVLPASGHGIAVMANTGTAHTDAHTIGAALVSLIEEGEPSPPESDSARVWIDAVLLALTVGVAVLSWYGVRGSRSWAGRRGAAPVWAVVRLFPFVLPPLLLVTLHKIVGFLFRGRDVSWAQVFYLYPTFMVMLATAALGCVFVVAARVIGFRRKAVAVRPPSAEPAVD